MRFILLILFVTLTSLRGHHRLHKRLHKVSHNNIRDDKFQFDIYLDVVQQTLNASQAYNKKEFFNVVSENIGWNKDIGASEEIGWTNNKWSFSGELDAGSSLSSISNIGFTVGIKPQYTFRNDKRFSFFVYAFPKVDIKSTLFEYEEGTGGIYQFKHGFSLAADLSVTHTDLRSYVTLFSGGLIKIF